MCDRLKLMGAPYGNKGAVLSRVDTICTETTEQWPGLESDCEAIALVWREQEQRSKPADTSHASWKCNHEWEGQHRSVGRPDKV